MPPIKAGFQMGVGSRFLVVANREVRSCAAPHSQGTQVGFAGMRTVEVFNIWGGSPDIRAAALERRARKKNAAQSSGLARADAIEGARLDQRTTGS